MLPHTLQHTETHWHYNTLQHTEQLAKSLQQLHRFLDLACNSPASSNRFGRAIAGQPFPKFFLTLTIQSLQSDLFLYCFTFAFIRMFGMDRDFLTDFFVALSTVK